jgi:hypothetical protein
VQAQTLAVWWQGTQGCFHFNFRFSSLTLIKSTHSLCFDRQSANSCMLSLWLIRMSSGVDAVANNGSGHSIRQLSGIFGC